MRNSKGSKNNRQHRNNKTAPEELFFTEEKVYNRPQIILNPLNDKQRRYINAIMQHHVVLGVGSAGTSKSYIPTTIACQLLTQKRIDKLIICRPPEGPGKSLGFDPGTELEKLECWVRPIVSIIKTHLSDGHFKYLVNNGQIEFCDLHKIKGRTFDDSFIIADEAEDMDVETIKSLTTRIGKNSKLVINGDIKQTHITKQSGLGFLLKLIDSCDLPIPVIEFTLDECVRSDVVKMFLEAFEREEEHRFRNRNR